MKKIILLSALISVPAFAQYAPATGLTIVQPAGSGGGGGVTQIVAGTGIGISPSGGTGVVTITNTGAGSGTVSSIAPADGSLTFTPNPIVSTGTIGLNVGNANSWTAAQTFANSDLQLLGSSTGHTTFTSANAGASNFTLTFPALTDTLVTLTASQTLTNKTLTSPTLTTPTVSSGNVTITPFSTAGIITNNSSGVLASLSNASSPSSTLLGLLASGTASSSTFLRGDGTWAAAGGGSGTVTTTGSPASTYLSAFSGSTSITGTANAELAGTNGNQLTLSGAGALATFHGNGPGTTVTDGLFLQDTTNTGSDEYAPALHWQNYDSAGRRQDWWLTNVPGGGGGSGQDQLTLYGQLNGGAVVNLFGFQNSLGSTSSLIFQGVASVAFDGTTMSLSPGNSGRTTRILSQLYVQGLTTTYDNISTAGFGVPAIYGYNRSTAQTAAVASVATYTVGGSDGSFIVSANVNVTASTTHSFTVTCTYTDETNTSRVLTLNFSQLTGTFVTAITNVTGASAYEGVPVHIRAKAGTAITIATTGTFTSVTYNVEGQIQQID